MNKLILLQVIVLFMSILFPLHGVESGRVDYSGLSGNGGYSFFYKKKNNKATVEGRTNLFYPVGTTMPDFKNINMGGLGQQNPSDYFLSERNLQTYSWRFTDNPFEDPAEGVGIIPPGPPIQGIPIQNDLKTFLILALFYSIFRLSKIFK